MKNVEVLRLVVDIATKHAKHNQKTHGRRGGGAAVDPTYTPSERAMEIVNKFARMQEDPYGYFGTQERMNAANQEVTRLAKEMDDITAQGGDASEKGAQVYYAMERLRRLVEQKDSLPVKVDQMVKINSFDPRDPLPVTFEVKNDQRGDFNRESREYFSAARDAYGNVRRIAAVEDLFNGQEMNLIFDMASDISGKKLTRAGYDPETGNIVVGEPSRRSLVHEIAHLIEARNPKIAQASQRFLEQRTKGEEARSLNDLYREQGRPSGLGDDEVGRPDRFIEPYIGKEYRDGNGKVYGTEVLSMGLEYMMMDPVGFAKRDPEHFAFVLDTLQNPANFGD